MKKLCLIALTCVSVFGQKVDYVHQVANKPILDMRQYQFSFSPVSGLAAGNTTVTFPVVPQGVNGTDLNHFLYASGGTGAAEACQIVGGSGTSGQANGQITLNCGHSHSGAVSLQSSTAGIQEAINASPNNVVLVPAGTYTIYSTIQINNFFTINGSGRGPTILSTTYTGGPMFQVNGGSGGLLHLNDVTLSGPAGFATGTGGTYAISLINSSSSQFERVQVYGFSNGVSITGLSNSGENVFRDFVVQFVTGYGFNINCAPQAGTLDNVIISGSSGSTGIGAFNTVGLELSSVYMNSNSYGLLVEPGSGQTVSGIQAFNLYVDGYGASPQTGIAIGSTGTGVVNQLVFEATQSWGNAIGFSIGGNADTVKCSGCIAGQNSTYGFDIASVTAGLPKNLSFIDSSAAGNGSSTAPGMIIGTGTGAIQIIGGVYAQSIGQSNTQTYGIFAYPSTGLVIRDAVVTPNITGGIGWASGTGTGNSVTGVIGYNPVGMQTITPTPASGSTTFVYTSGASPEVVYIQGGTISSLVRCTLAGCSGGGKVVANTTAPTGTSYIIPIAPNTSIQLTYTATPTQMFTDIQ